MMLNGAETTAAIFGQGVKGFLGYGWKTPASGSHGEAFCLFTLRMDSHSVGSFFFSFQYEVFSHVDFGFTYQQRQAGKFLLGWESKLAASVNAVFFLLFFF